MADLLDRINVLIDQEQRFYKTEDYLAPECQDRLTSSPEDDCSVSTGTNSSACMSDASSACMNETWREMICQWSYQVVDHFDFSREIVSISMHYLDRYLSTRAVSKKVFQLAAMTSLFLAIKLYESKNMTMTSMIELSRGYFRVEQMAEMETLILRALTWNVHPPTTYCFSKHILFLLPYTTVPMDKRHALLELARFLSELSVVDYFFVAHRPSIVALASLLNALDIVPGISDSAVESFKTEISRIARLDWSRADVAECRERLTLLYTQGEYDQYLAPEEDERVELNSPVCVSEGCIVQTQVQHVTTSQHQSQQRHYQTQDHAANQWQHASPGGKLSYASDSAQ